MAVNNSLVKSKSDSNPLEITFKAETLMSS